jgi:hypothetical protein
MIATIITITAIISITIAGELDIALLNLPAISERFQLVVNGFGSMDGFFSETEICISSFHPGAM